MLTWAALFLARAIAFAAIDQNVLAWASARGSLAGHQLPLFAYGLVKTLASMILAAVLLASAFRAILRPRAQAPFGFGREELLVLASQFITQLIAALPVLAGFGAIVLVHGLAGVLPRGRWAETVFQTLGLFWSVVASVWAFGRLEIAPFRSWAIARGRFWLLAGLVLGVLVLRLFINAGVDDVAAALSRSLPAGPALFRNVMFAVLEALEIAILAGVVCTAYGARPPEPRA